MMTRATEVMIRMILSAALVLLLGWPLPGCKGGAEEPARGAEKTADPETPAAPEAPPAPEAVVGYAAEFTAAAAAAEFKVEPFEEAAARPHQAAECRRGIIAKLDVLICRYQDEAAARAGEEKLRRFASGAVSGAARIRGALGLAIADREKADPTGKTINELLTLFADPGSGG
jgi:hypothetical protein